MNWNTHLLCHSIDNVGTWRSILTSAVKNDSQIYTDQMREVHHCHVVFFAIKQYLVADFIVCKAVLSLFLLQTLHIPPSVMPRMSVERFLKKQILDLTSDNYSVAIRSGIISMRICGTEVFNLINHKYPTI